MAQKLTADIDDPAAERLARVTTKSKENPYPPSRKDVVSRGIILACDEFEQKGGRK